jgi:7-cyano-7-deazaguanine reductase
VSDLTKLGNPEARADGVLEVFPVDDASLEIVLDCTEFTCRCPVTGQPDWATIEIRYRPAGSVVETKSLKLYLETYRELGIFHEHAARRIRDDLVAALDPVSLSVEMRFNRRGGIAVRATSSYPPESADAR